MLQDIFKQIQGGLGAEIAQKFNLTPDQTTKTVETFGSTLESAFTKQSSGGLDMLTNLFGGGAKNTQSNGFVQGLIASVATNLISKVGLNEGIAKSIASEFTPKVIDMLTQKSGGDLNALFGGAGGLGSVLGSLGGMFKK